MGGAEDRRQAHNLKVQIINCCCIIIYPLPPSSSSPMMCLGATSTSCSSKKKKSLLLLLLLLLRFQCLPLNQFHDSFQIAQIFVSFLFYLFISHGIFVVVSTSSV